jgi:hypothetical protein
MQQQQGDAARARGPSLRSTLYSLLSVSFHVRTRSPAGSGCPATARWRRVGPEASRRYRCHPPGFACRACGGSACSFPTSTCHFRSGEPWLTPPRGACQPVLRGHCSRPLDDCGPSTARNGPPGLQRHSLRFHGLHGLRMMRTIVRPTCRASSFSLPAGLTLLLPAPSRTLGTSRASRGDRSRSAGRGQVGGGDARERPRRASLTRLQRAATASTRAGPPTTVEARHNRSTATNQTHA